MTIEEPQLLGAVVETEDGRVFMRFPGHGEYTWIGRDPGNAGADAWRWCAVADNNPVLRFEGFTPRLKEPTLLCAVVRDAYGFLFARVGVASRPWRVLNPGVGLWSEWHQIIDPEIIFEGVSE